MAGCLGRDRSAILDFVAGSDFGMRMTRVLGPAERWWLVLHGE